MVKVHQSKNNLIKKVEERGKSTSEEGKKGKNRDKSTNSNQLIEFFSDEDSVDTTKSKPKSKINSKKGSKKLIVIDKQI